MSDSTTARLHLPLLAAAQAQKELYHNEALALIDLCLNGHALAMNSETPPDAPQPGQCWILGAAPNGDWAGHPNEIAGWTAGGWRFVSPSEGCQMWLDEALGTARFTNGQWGLDKSYGPVFVAGQQIIGERLPTIAEPSAGTVVDAEARTALTAMLSALRTHGLIA